MVEDKVGQKEYLGIKIDYDKENKLNKFSLDTLKDRYLYEASGETHAQEAFARASIFGATFKGVTDFELAQRLYKYSSDLWFMFSTPILSNGGTNRGLPISCFLNYVPDSRDGLSSHYDENIWLASSGGGIGGYWGDIRSNGIATANNSRSTGSIPFMKVVDSQMLAFNQGVTRRGSYASYMDINHPEIEEFINIRKESGGDINRKCLNIHNGVNITNEFLQAVQEDADWRLIDPKTGEAVKTINARDLWWQIINTRAETGEPYMINIDTCNEALPKEQKALGLNIKQSLKGLKTIYEKVKKALQSQASLLIEKGRLAWGQWVSTPTYKRIKFRLKESLRQDLITKLLTISKVNPWMRVKFLRKLVAKLLTLLVQVSVTLIFIRFVPS